MNVINSAFQMGVRKLLLLGSSCIYPKFADQPIKETELLRGPLEASNSAYALAKITGIKTCESYNRQYGESHGVDYRCVMPSNLYGPGDNYHPDNSHVLPSLIRKFHESQLLGKPNVNVWGSGLPLREFLHTEDLAHACYFIMNLKTEEYKSVCQAGISHINVGSGEEISIGDLAKLIKEIIGFKGVINFDDSKPDGTPRKIMDSSIVKSLGWSAKIKLSQGIEAVYEDYKRNLS